MNKMVTTSALEAIYYQTHEQTELDRKLTDNRHNTVRDKERHKENTRWLMQRH